MQSTLLHITGKSYLGKLWKEEKPNVGHPNDRNDKVQCATWSKIVQKEQEIRHKMS